MVTAFMAPEVITQKGYGRSADIWSLGCVIIEMTTGKRPWSEMENMHQIMFKVCIISTALPEPTLHLPSTVGLGCGGGVLGLRFSLLGLWGYRVTVCGQNEMSGDFGLSAQTVKLFCDFHRALFYCTVHHKGYRR